MTCQSHIKWWCSWWTRSCGTVLENHGFNSLYGQGFFSLAPFSDWLWGPMGYMYSECCMPFLWRWSGQGVKACICNLVLRLRMCRHNYTTIPPYLFMIWSLIKHRACFLCIIVVTQFTAPPTCFNFRFNFIKLMCRIKYVFYLNLFSYFSWCGISFIKYKEKWLQLYSVKKVYFAVVVLSARFMALSAY